MPHVDWVRGPLPQGLRRLGAGSWDGGPAPVPPAVGAEAHAAAGTCAAFRLHYLPAPVEVGYESYGPAAGAADPLGSRVGDTCPCPGVHVGLSGSSRSGDLLAHRQ